MVTDHCLFHLILGLNVTPKNRKWGPKMFLIAPKHTKNPVKLKLTWTIETSSCR